MKNRVITKAYECAILNDIEDISLVKISNDLEISRRSLYRMFNDKYELMYEVYKIIIDELLVEAHKLNEENNCNNGYECTIQAMGNMISVFLNNPKKIKYITKFDALNIESTSILKEKNNFYRKCDFTYGALIKGVGDGSINLSVEPYKMSCVILETIMGVVSRFHDLDKEEYTDYMDRKDIYKLIDVFACYLKA